MYVHLKLNSSQKPVKTIHKATNQTHKIHQPKKKPEIKTIKQSNLPTVFFPSLHCSVYHSNVPAMKRYFELTELTVS